MSKREKTVTRSFRISESAFKALEEDASQRNISVNTLVNQLLLAHTNIGRFLDKFGTIRMTRPSFSKLLNVCTDTSIIEVARSVASDAPKTIILAKYGVISLRTVLDYIRSMNAYAGWGDYGEVESQGKLIITQTHNLGRKGTLFISNYLESVFGLADVHPKTSLSEHSLIFEI
ncbi:MAG TPA: hypothetical protein VLV31_13545 [Candidatus Acidoferrales bacterium]|nr:hypothetical protein [Candidatus Acidoferrales bacterium]